MYTLLRNGSLHQLLAAQAPALLISFLIASFFFKWGSFALECLGFLALWFVLDAAFAAVFSTVFQRREKSLEAKP